jgi:hypothetical protein
MSELFGTIIEKLGIGANSVTYGIDDPAGSSPFPYQTITVPCPAQPDNKIYSSSIGPDPQVMVEVAFRHSDFPGGMYFATWPSTPDVGDFLLLKSNSKEYKYVIVARTWEAREPASLYSSVKLDQPLLVCDVKSVTSSKTSSHEEMQKRLRLRKLMETL